MSFLSTIGWSPAHLEHLPRNTRPARVSRVDRGLLTVLTADGERRVRPVAALHDGAGEGAPVVGDWVALDGERAVEVLPRRTAFVRTVAGRTSAMVGPCRFRDCGHRGEPGCAVDDGRLDPARFLAWRKPVAESRRQRLRVDARPRALEHARARPRPGHRPELARDGEDGVL